MTYQDYLDGTRQVLEESQQETKPYLVKVLDKDFIVYPGVFSPKYFRDTEIFAKNFKVKPDEQVLEIGPGTGVLSITAGLQGAKVTTIDINPIAVENTKQNIKRHQLQNQIRVRRGDLYDAVLPEEQFNTILWNTPFGLLNSKVKLSNLEKSVFDPGYKATRRFILEAPKFLSQDGRILVGFSSTLGRLDLIKQFCYQIGFELELLHEEDSTETYSVKFELFEARAK